MSAAAAAAASLAIAANACRCRRQTSRSLWRTGRGRRFFSSHVDEGGKPRMVDVGAKVSTRRTATARSSVRLPDQVLSQITRDSRGCLMGPKGPISHTAIIAGTMAAKKTANLIPFCHPLPIDRCDVNVEFQGDSGEVQVTCTVSTQHKTGVEMEALTGASVASLAIYDMLKGLGHNISIAETRLVSKVGGKNDFRG